MFYSIDQIICIFILGIIAGVGTMIGFHFHQKYRYALDNLSRAEGFIKMLLSTLAKHGLAVSKEIPEEDEEDECNN